MWENLIKKIFQSRSTPRRPSPVPAGSVIRGKPTEAADVHGGGGEKKERKERGRPFRQERRTLYCPVCSIPMRIVSIGKVDIDQCPDCGGIFLDRGELKELSGLNVSRYERSTERDQVLIYTPEGLSGRVGRHEP